MATNIQCTKAAVPAAEGRLATLSPPPLSQTSSIYFGNYKYNNNYLRKLRVSAVDRKGVGDGGANNNIKKQGGGGSAPSSASAVPSSNYVVPLDKSSSITRPLGEILRDLNRKIPDNIIKIRNHGSDSTFIPWYHANRMLSFYAPGWWGEIRDIIFSDNGSVTVVYRVTIRGSDGEAYRESTGTVSSADGHIVDPVAAAEEIAFCRACARFGLGLYLYHDE